MFPKLLKNTTPLCSRKRKADVSVEILIRQNKGPERWDQQTSHVTVPYNGRRTEKMSSNPLGLSRKMKRMVKAIVQTDSVGVKKRPQLDTPIQHLLHATCSLFPRNTTVVKISLFLEPNAIRQRSTNVEQVPQNDTSRVINNGTRYSLPINIAISHGASMDVLDVLIGADPSVLVLKDGWEGSTSLTIALQSFQHSQEDLLQIMKRILSFAPKCIQVPDRKLNYPLHIACYTGASLKVVGYLYNEYPKALSHKNFNDENPLTIAQRNSRCPEDALNFLQDCLFSCS